MLKEDFLCEIDRLSNNFGRNKFPEEKIVSLWDCFKKEDISVFKQAVTNAILDMKQCPNRVELWVLVNDIKPKSKDALVNKQKDSYCSWCGNSGYVSARQRVRKEGEYAYEVLFRCRCIIGASLENQSEKLITYCREDHDYYYELIPYDARGEVGNEPREVKIKRPAIVAESITVDSTPITGHTEIDFTPPNRLPDYLPCPSSDNLDF